MKKALYIAIFAALVAAISCGGNSNKKGKADGNVNPEQSSEVAATQMETNAEVVYAKEEPKAQSKKWHEQDFSMTYKQYVAGASMSRTYARKGNIVIGMVEGGGATTLCVCTDSTRTQYQVSHAGGTYKKTRERTGFESVDEAIRDFLKDQLGDNVFKGILKPDGKNCTASDTTIFGRPAYVITEEKTEEILSVKTYSKIIEWVDKENGLPYYKYAQSKNGDKVLIEGKAFEITAFSAEPAYEGLVVSLYGLTEIN